MCIKLRQGVRLAGLPRKGNVLDFTVADLTAGCRPPDLMTMCGSGGEGV